MVSPKYCTDNLLMSFQLKMRSSLYIGLNNIRNAHKTYLQRD
jgi:hypothetical protein